MSKDFEFQALSWYAEDFDYSDIDDSDKSETSSSASNNQPKKQKLIQDTLFYVIKAFGRTVSGESASLTITGFRPFFYIKVGDKWNRECTEILLDALKKGMGQRAFYNLDHDQTCIVERKDIWGFTDSKKFKFLKFAFKSCKYMKIAAKFLMTREVTCKRLHPEEKKYQVYESNVEPYLRFFHINKINPCGWLRVKNSASIASILPTFTSFDRQASHIDVSDADVNKERQDTQFKIMSFDIECMSLTGEFPVAKRDYSRLATAIYDAAKKWMKKKEEVADYSMSPYDLVTRVVHLAARILGASDAPSLPKLDPFSAREVDIASTFSSANVFETSQASSALVSIIKSIVDDLLALVKSPPYVEPKNDSKNDKEKKGEDEEESVDKTPQEEIDRQKRENAVREMTLKLNNALPKLRGDPVIQIGATVHKYGERKVCLRKIVTLGTCDAIPVPEDGIETVVVECKTETDVLLKFADIVKEIDPDIVTGYNIFGFDMMYVEQRAHELKCKLHFMMRLNRLVDRQAEFKTQLLSSSALGDNYLNYIDMPGRVLIDLMKVVQRDHKLDSYKLDDVAFAFTEQRKKDVSPQEIFSLQKGSSRDRRTVAEYCVQDCELVNGLVIKLEVIANNTGMANVCSVPLSYIFMRGQGIKIFSLVLSQCHQNDYVVPVVKMAALDENGKSNETEPSYEGATVLTPECDIYMDDPVSVLDYASLYPSSMISENLSHDTLVIDEAYANLPGVKYRDIEYDVIDSKKLKTRKEVCRFVDRSHIQGLLPRTLEQLLTARKTTRAKIKDVRVFFEDGDSRVVSSKFADATIIDGKTVVRKEEAYSAFQQSVLEGLQLAYKLTANSLYGQMGAKTSQLLLKHLAACTTATGRKMIFKAKTFLEKEFNARVIYGDTDSIFCIFPSELKGKEALKESILLAHAASKEFSKHIEKPHDLEYDKTFWPFILLSKKRYVGNLYEGVVDKCKQKSMGIVLNRRDNAPIVKDIYLGVIKKILQENDLNGSVVFLKEQLEKIHETPMDKLIVSKTLKDKYASPLHIAHKVLADRMAERDPGTRPQVGDRIPYVYVVVREEKDEAKKKKKMLQGNRIEHPTFITQNNLVMDYQFYITNQIMKPVLQVFGLVVEKLEGYNRPPGHFEHMRVKLLEKEKDSQKVADKIATLRETCAGELLFNPILGRLDCMNSGNKDISSFFNRIEF